MNLRITLIILFLAISSLSFGQSLAYKTLLKGYYDKDEYAHLLELSRLQCTSWQVQALAEIEQIQNALQVSYDIALRVKGDIEESADSLGIDPEIIGGYNDLSNAIDMAEVNAEDLASYAQDDIFSGF